jgi:hypothetical protein
MLSHWNSTSLEPPRDSSDFLGATGTLPRFTAAPNSGALATGLPWVRRPLGSPVPGYLAGTPPITARGCSTSGVAPAPQCGGERRHRSVWRQQCKRGLRPPDLPSNCSSLRDLNCTHSNYKTHKSPVSVFIVTTSPSRDWVICAPAAFLGCGSRFSGSLSGVEP